MARKKISFIVDTGATFSLLTSYSGPTQDSEFTIKGGLWSSPKAKNQSSITLSIWKGDPYTLIPHNASVPNGTPRERFVIQIGVFITIPHLDTVSIFCMQMAPRQSLSLSPDLPLDLTTLNPQVWDIDHPSISKHHPPVHIILKDPLTIITQQ